MAVRASVAALNIAVNVNAPVKLQVLLPGVSEGRVRVVGTTDDASAAAALVRRHHADVAVVDLHMPPPGGTCRSMSRTVCPAFASLCAASSTARRDAFSPAATSR